MHSHPNVEQSGISGSAVEKTCLQQNYDLSAIPAPERERLAATLKQVYLPLGSVLYESGDTLHHIYFPTGCIVSLLHELRDGSSAGIATIGNEGAVGIELFMGGDTMTNRAVVQTAGSAYRLRAAQFKQDFMSHQ
jgi:CRP-like cAMP-binding protein